MTAASEPPGSLILTLNPGRVTRVLGLTVAVLIVAHLAVYVLRATTGHDHMFGMLPLFSLDYESNIASYFSAAQLLVAAFLLGAIAFLKRRMAARYAMRWTLLAFTFLYLSIDEAVGLHELMTGPMRHLLGPWASGVFFYTWVVPGAILALLLGLAYMKLLEEFPVRLRRMVVIAAALFCGGIIGMELVGGWYTDHYGQDFVYGLLVMIEEGAEMAGIVVFIHALLEYLGQTIGELRLRFTRS